MPAPLKEQPQLWGARQSLSLWDLLRNWCVSCLVTSLPGRAVSLLGKKCIRAWVNLPKNSLMFWKQDAWALPRKRNGKRNSLKRKKANSPTGIPSPSARINSDLSFRPPLWLSSWPPVTRADPRHQRRIGGMAQLLGGWLEFPATFPRGAELKSTGLQQQRLRKDRPEQF